ncbi:MAG: protein-(glutamine-N5) methyltransferase, release factor-specific, partial [Ignavibacteria bacterium RIFOXYB2_FULL_36_7]
DLYLSYDRPLNEDEVKLYREFIRRRIKSEPLQYIIGKVEFYGIEFNVNPSVLIPRQETEILVETIINSVNKDGSLKILDVGVGSGNISISLAKHLPYSKITATDISEQALETAKANAEMNNVLEKINFIKHDILSHNLNDEFDIVVSNPPYISREEFPQLKDELKVYEPQNALTDFSDGLNYYRIISSKAKEFVKSKGKIFFEVGQGQVEDVKRILAENNFNEISIVKDYLKIDRVISGVKN